MRVGPLAVLVGLALSLTGCFDLLQEIWIEPDGGARCRIVYTFEDAEAERRAKLDTLLEGVKSTQEELRRDPNVRSVSVRAETADARLQLVVEVAVADATQLMSYVRKALQPRDMLVRARVPAQNEFAIERLASGGYIFRQTQAAKNDPLYKEHTATVRLHAPVLLVTNGAVVDGSTEWRFKLARPREGMPEVLRAEVATRTPLQKYGPFAGAGVALLAAGFCWSRWRRARGS